MALISNPCFASDGNCISVMVENDPLEPNFDKILLDLKVDPSACNILTCGPNGAHAPKSILGLEVGWGVLPGVLYQALSVPTPPANQFNTLSTGSILTVTNNGALWGGSGPLGCKTITITPEVMFYQPFVGLTIGATSRTAPGTEYVVDLLASTTLTTYPGPPAPTATSVFLRSRLHILEAPASPSNGTGMHSTDDAIGNITLFPTTLNPGDSVSIQLKWTFYHSFGNAPAASAGNRVSIPSAYYWGRVSE